MLEYLSSFFFYFLELMIALFFLYQVASPKVSGLWTAAIGLGLYASAALLSFLLENNVWVNVVSSVLSVFLLCFICFSLNYRLALFYSLLLNTFGIISEFLVIFIQSSISASLADYSVGSAVYYQSGAISKILFFFICLLLSRFLRRRRTLKNPPAFFLLFPLASTFILLVFGHINLRTDLPRLDSALVLLSDVFLLAANTLLFATLIRHQEKQEKLAASEREADELKNQLAVISLMEQQNEDMRRFAHDINNHLTALAQLSSDAEVKKYISALSQKLTGYSAVCHSGNPTLDAVLNRYSYECQAQHIEFLFDVRVFNLSNMENTDLVTLMTNLLDNAVQAAARSGEKRISLETTTRNAFGVVILSNSCDTAPAVRNGALISSKKDTLFHGLGLKIVNRILNQYNGFMDWEYCADKKEFTLTFALNQHSSGT